jgi:hypothetical protein
LLAVGQSPCVSESFRVRVPVHTPVRAIDCKRDFNEYRLSIVNCYPIVFRNRGGA